MAWIDHKGHPRRSRHPLACEVNELGVYGGPEARHAGDIPICDQHVGRERIHMCLVARVIERPHVCKDHAWQIAGCNLLENAATQFANEL